VTTLYRFFDADDRLLYVGIAGNPGRRFHQHANGPDGKPWWSHVARSTMEHFDTREEAAAAEVAAIVTERPMHNVVHNRSTSPRQAAAPAGGVVLTDRSTYPHGVLVDGTYWWLEWYGGNYCNLVVDWVWGLPPMVDGREWHNRAWLGAGAVLVLDGDDALVSPGIRSLPHPPAWTEHTVDFMLAATRGVTKDAVDEWILA